MLSFVGLWRLNRPTSSGLEKKAQTKPKGPSGSKSTAKVS